MVKQKLIQGTLKCLHTKAEHILATSDDSHLAFLKLSFRMKQPSEVKEVYASELEKRLIERTKSYQNMINFN